MCELKEGGCACGGCEKKKPVTTTVELGDMTREEIKQFFLDFSYPHKDQNLEQLQQHILRVEMEKDLLDQRLVMLRLQYNRLMSEKHARKVDVL